MALQTKAPTFSLHQALDSQPLQVSSDTPIDGVISLMSQASVHCHIPVRAADEPPLSAAPLAVSTHQHTSCVLVVDSGQLTGILTEKDIVRLIATDKALAGLTAADLMTHPVVTLPDGEGLDIFSALNVMRHHHIHHLSVVNDQGEVIGLLTPKWLRSLMEPADFMRFRLVHEVMSSQVVHALPTAPVLQIVQQLIQHQVSCVVIVAAVEGKSALAPVGIVTERDIVQIQRLGLDLKRTQAQTVMSAPLFLVSPQDSLWDVDKVMRHLRCVGWSLPIRMESWRALSPREICCRLIQLSCMRC